MFYVDAYLNSLPDDVEEININNKELHVIPSLTKFWNLKIFHCSNNSLTSLPPLPATLTYLCCDQNQLISLPQLPATLIGLYCYNNLLTSLPQLPATLTYMNCSKNQLTSLPQLPATLTHLDCSKNQLTSLPQLPATLTHLDCSKNQLTSLPQLPATLINLHCFNNFIWSIVENSSISATRIQVNTLNKFRFTFYLLKCKKRLRDFLWQKIREPRIKARFNPLHLLEGITEETDLDAFIDEWVKTAVY
jgi:hypothetical protein